jgi:hypothetical protein
MLQVSSTDLAAIVARPERFLSTYQNLNGGASVDAYVRSQLGTSFASLSEAGCIAAFGSVVAFSIAPAGENSLDAMTATLRQLLTAPALAANHFCKLNALLALLGTPGLIPPGAAGAATKASLHFLVWLDTVPLGTGAHTQLVISNVLQQAYLLLDPMYALALQIPFVGGGPNAGLTVTENAAGMLQTSVTPDNLAVLNAVGTSAVPQLIPALLGGTLGPQYLDKSAAGSDAWDMQIARAFSNMG